MFGCKFQTKFTRLLRTESLATILQKNPSFTQLQKFSSLSFQFVRFPQYSSFALPQEISEHAVSPIETSHAACWRGTAPYDASQLLDKMSHSRPKKSDYPLLRDVFKIVQIVTRDPSVVSAALVHALALKQGALADLPFATSVLTAYSRAKDFRSSLGLFGEIPGKDVVLWNAMITACAENKLFDTAVDCFKKMVGEEGYGYDLTTLVVVMTALSNSRSLIKGQIVHGLSVKNGMLKDLVFSNALIDMYAKCGDFESSECIFEGTECKDIVSWNTVISGCLRNDRPDEALRYFRHMTTSKNDVDSVSISCSMAACTCLRECSAGLAIHGYGIKSGYAESNHISVANSLISFYFQFRDICAALHVFKGIVFKNLVSWNSMIKGLLLNGEVAEALHCLHSMQFVGSTQPDIATLVTIIPFCAELMLLREGKAAHGFTIRREMVTEFSVINSLINMYSKNNNIIHAEYLFVNMPQKDLMTWNTMIFGYALNGEHYEAQALFKKMLVCFSKCTLPTLLAATASCDFPESLQFGRSIHVWHVKLGFSDHTFAVNALMHMYIICGDLVATFALLGGMLVKCDITSWNTVIAGCNQNGYSQEVLESFNLMRKTSLALHNSTTLLNVITACGNLGSSFNGKLLHGLALKTPSGYDVRVQNSLITMYGRVGDTESARLAFNLSHDHNLCSWNCVISALSQNEDAKRALELFRSLDFEPNEITISTVLSACTQLGEMQYGKQIHGHVFRFGFHKNPFISSALLDMYSSCGRLDFAEKVFLRSPKRSIPTWNSLISAYGFHNFGEKAIETFQEMIRIGIHPSNSTFTSLLSACSHSGLVDEGCVYYDHMFSKYQVQPETEHYVCMVHMLGRAGKLREAYDFINNLPLASPQPGVWGALLSSCSYHGDVDMGREVAHILFALEPENVSYYVALCNMYVAAGRWEEAVELRTLIHDKQLKKPAGYSVIDVGLR
ncbi:pentatricopeptide repeat-containing protein mitochondrial [Dorcoceras hygrometricum]|uniref:Pentatricopeptide repeat-containing protein mitochondrial n=1 Tax=Dorcoceras hygrometricum TaxID=472368 RepID=A0A2Z7BBV0_9LAMI|nr:pentatricopeptide repeat-containing protein mitochondrial [Dorcoceras hygrometricum]